MLINGTSTDKISATDRGLQYGDGLFETIAVVNRKPRLWERHMTRLTLSENRLGLPAQDKIRLLEEACSLISGDARAVIKIVLTRGVGGRGYRPSSSPQTTRIVSLHDWPDYPENWYTTGITLRVCRTRVGRSKALAGIKHLNRLEQVLARQEWDDPMIAEGLMLDEKQHVIEATQSNLFLVKGRTLITPSLSDSGVAGIVRELVLEVTEALGIESVISEITLDDVAAADALFITNSLLGICPVVALGEIPFDIRKIPSTLRNRVQRLCLGSSLRL